MLRVAWKGVLARKLRLVLTSIAIVLGVGFVSGAFFLTDSLRASFDTIFTEAAQGIDVQVQTKAYKELALEQAKRGPGQVPIDLSKVGTPPSVVEQIDGLPGVQRVAGNVFEIGAQPLDKDGVPISTGGAPAFAANWDEAGEDVGALKLVKGDAPERDEILLDTTTMKRGKYEIGDTVGIAFQGGRTVEQFTISGVVKFGTSNSLNGAAISVFETAQIQELLGMGENFTAVQVQAESGVTQQTLKRTVRGALGPDYDVITGEEFTQEQSEAIDTGFLNILQNVILGFAAIAVFVGAFTIFNTFTILVGQRTREFGLLRAIGASRRQVLGIVLLEALVIGVIASTLGIASGYVIATLLRSLINSFADGSIPTEPFPLATRTVVWAYTVGIGITVIASVLPAWRAARLSPLEALRSNSAAAGRGWKGPLAGAVLVAAGSALISFGFIKSSLSVTATLSSIGGGFAVAIIGIALLSRMFIAPVTRGLAFVSARGTSGDLAKRNVLRNRARSATTASALMIGLALASLVLVFQASLKTSISDQISKALAADITIYNTTAFETGVGVVEQRVVDRIKDVDGVETVATQRFGTVSLGTAFDPTESIEPISGFDESSLSEDGLIALKIVDGDTTPGDGILVDEDIAKRENWAVGDEVKVAASGDTTATYTIRGIYEPNQFVGAALIVTSESFDALQPPQLRAPFAVYVQAESGVSPSKLVKRISNELGNDAGSLEIQDSEGLQETFDQQLAPILGLVLGMLSLSLIIALFGIGNTMALNVFERTREIGLLRAVGATRWQVRRMIGIEAVLVAVFGAIVGVLVGIIAGWALIRALADEGFTFSINPMTLVAILIVGFIAGILASLLPARRAARTDVLEAIATE